MVSEELKQQILQKDKYSAYGLSKMGFIKNNKDNPFDYNFILKLIDRKQLRFVNMNEGGTNPVYQISAQAVIDYLNSFE